MLVGREQELRTLNAAFRQMQNGKGGVLFVTGEAGLGKTTLVHEWWKNTIAPAVFAEAACSIPIGNVDVGAIEALQPWADIIAQLHSYEGENKSALNLKKLIRDAAPAWAWAIPIVGEIAHAALETARLVKEQRDGNLDASNQQQVFQQYANLLAKIAEETPLVLLFDDMHWADTSSTNLLFHIARQIPQKKILIIATYRADDATTANSGKGHPIMTVKDELIRYDIGKELALGFLDGDAIRQLLAKTFGEYAVNTTFEGWLRKISDGNSLFVTQFIKTLQEDGYLSANGTFTGDYDKIAIPSSALAVVSQRIRRLDDETRELLSYATAEGEEFTSYVLGQLTAKKPLELLRDLRKAETAGIVQSKKDTRQFANQTTTVFGFSHALFHKALYEGLLSEERDILHRQCYEILKREWDRLANAQERPISLASKLLTHAEKCGELEAAADAAYGAADIAWKNYSESEAMEMIRHGKRLAASPLFPADRRAAVLGDVLLLQGQIAELRGRYDEELETSKEALEYFHTLHNERKIVDTLVARSWIIQLKGNFDASEQEARAGFALAEKIGSQKGKAGALNIIGLAHQSRGMYDDARKYLSESLALRESVNDLFGVAASLNNLGLTYAEQGLLEKALEYFIKGLGIAETGGFRQWQANMLSNIGAVHHDRNEYDKALEYYSRSLKIMETIGDRGGIAGMMLNMGMTRHKLHDLPQARTLLEQADSLLQEIKMKSYQALTTCQLGLVCESEAMQCAGSARNTKLREAISLLESGLALFREQQSPELAKYERELERIRKELQ